MDLQKVSERDDDSECDLSENWTFVETEEALEATEANISVTKTEEEIDPEISSLLTETSERATIPESNAAKLPETQVLNVAKLTETDIVNNENGGGDILHADSDDGVSIITDSDPEELGFPSSDTLCTPFCNKINHGQSMHVNDYFDQSDLSTQQELLEDIGERGDRKYVHHSNQKLSLTLNALVIIFMAAVLGLGFGHFVGLQEKCPVAHPSVTRPDFSDDAATLFQKLESENVLLKIQLKQLQKGIDKKEVDQRNQELSSTSISINGAKNTDSDSELQRTSSHVTLDLYYDAESLDNVDNMGQIFANNLIKISSDQDEDLLVNGDFASLNNQDLDHTENLVDLDLSEESGQIYPKGQTIMHSDGDKWEGDSDYCGHQDHSHYTWKAPTQEPQLDNIDSENLFSKIPNSEDLNIILRDNIKEDCDTKFPEIPDINEVQRTKLPENPLVHTYKIEASNPFERRKTEVPETPSEDIPKTKTVKNHSDKSNNKNKQNRDRKQPPDHFFTKMEEEVNRIMQKVFQFGKDFSKKHNMKDHVTSSINKISDTLIDMQGKIRTLGVATAQHSAYAMGKIKKKLSKIVQNIKDNSESLLKNSKDANLSSKVIRGFNHLKDGFVRRWSNLQDKMSQKFSGEKQATEKIVNQQSTLYSKGRDYSSALPKYQKKHEKDFDSYTKKTKHDKNDKYRQKDQKYHGDKKLYNEKGNKKNTKHENHFQKYSNERNHKVKLESREKNGHKYYKTTKSSDDTSAQAKQKIEKQNDSHFYMRREKYNNTDGGWLHNLATGRATQRRLEQESDWIFDRARSRATYRQNERNEDWYLRRSKSRQQYRGNVIHQGHSIHVKHV